MGASDVTIHSPVKRVDNKAVLKTIVVRARKDTLDRGVSRAVPIDPFISQYQQGMVIEPPFDLLTLAMMPEQCSELVPALDAMVVNIDKLGYRIIPKIDETELNEEISPSTKREQMLVRNFFANAVLDDSFSEFRARVRRDLETTGNAYIEVIPKLSDPKIPAGLTHLPSWTMRLREQDKEYTKYTVPRQVQDEDGKWKIEDFKNFKRFRRFVQMIESKAEMVYFKEWGDPREISSKTGDEYDPSSESEDVLAHEVIHLKLYSPRSPYGLPRWIGHLFAIFGTRSAEEINYLTMENNQIPAMVLLATNVAVTDPSIARMREFFEERVQGNKNFATCLMIEAEPVGEGMRDPGAMKLEMKPLAEYQHTDAMFREYIQMNNDMIRRAFRLPPIFVGRADDYNRAVAEASRKLAEEQIFKPERESFDELMNQTLVARLGAASVSFRSNSPKVGDNYELTQLLAVAERSGGLSPRISRMIVEGILGVDLPEVSPDILPDQPFSLTMQRDKMRARLASGNEEVEVDTEPADEISQVLHKILASATLSEEESNAIKGLLVDLAVVSTPYSEASNG